MLNHTIIGNTAPSTAPDHIGQNYYNSTTGLWYKANGYASSSDWIIISEGPSEIITLSNDTIKEFTLDLSNATKFKVESWGNNSGTGNTLGFLQFYCNGAWVTSNYNNDIAFISNAPAASLSAAIESGIRFTDTTSSTNNPFKGEFNNSSTEIFGRSELDTRIPNRYVHNTHTSVSVSGVATKCRLNIPSGTVSGKYKLSILG